MRVKKRMTVAEFEAVRPLLKISEDRVKAARAALVDGQTFKSVADMFGWSRQAVNNAVMVVWRTLENYRQSQRAEVNAGMLLPLGWEQVTLIAPNHLIEKFRAELAEELPKMTKKNKKKGRE